MPGSLFRETGVWLRCRLHEHTTNSDGEVSPAALCDHCRKRASTSSRSPTTGRNRARTTGSSSSPPASSPPRPRLRTARPSASPSVSPTSPRRGSPSPTRGTGGLDRRARRCPRPLSPVWSGLQVGRTRGTVPSGYRDLERPRGGAYRATACRRCTRMTAPGGGLLTEIANNDPIRRERTAAGAGPGSRADERSSPAVSEALRRGRCYAPPGRGCSTSRSMKSGRGALFAGEMGSAPVGPVGRLRRQRRPGDGQLAR